MPSLKEVSQTDTRGGEVDRPPGLADFNSAPRTLPCPAGAEGIKPGEVVRLSEIETQAIEHSKRALDLCDAIQLREKGFAAGVDFLDIGQVDLDELLQSGLGALAKFREAAGRLAANLSVAHEEDCSVAHSRKLAGVALGLHHVAWGLAELAALSGELDRKQVMAEVMAWTKDKPVPQFSAEQMDYLRHILTPPCCHCSGMHDPKHFSTHPDHVCELQARDAWKVACAALGFELVGQSVEGCYWCDSLKPGRDEAGPAPYSVGDRITGPPIYENPERRAGVVTCVYWGREDSKNQWLFEVKYDDGGTVASRSLRVSSLQPEVA